MQRNRRSFFGRLAALSAAAGARPGRGATEPVGVVTPDLPKLPYRMVDGVKEFHLIAEVVETDLVVGRPMTAWGFNGCVPGPMIEVNQGDRVRVIFENRLPEMSAVHWHGFEVPMEMDGSVGLGQDPVPPGGKFVYEWTLHQHGTLFYHSHFAMQEMMGMIGFVVIHPQDAYAPAVDRDYALVLQEWALLPNNPVPNTVSMEFNWLSFNGKSGPDCTPLVVKQGERVRIRLINMGMDHHPIHLHGHQFTMTGTEAGRVPEARWFAENTVLVGVAQARDIELVAKYTGDWMLHCHLPHHMMNQMVSMAGPMTHGMGLGTGAGMEEGMGMLQQGHALSDDFGPAMGRGMGLAADAEQPASTMAGPHAHHQAQAQPAADDPHAHHRGAAERSGHGEHAMEFGGIAPYPQNDPGKKQVRGYPQDMWMQLDHQVRPKPENMGLRASWTGAMMGMMTLLRVMEPERYEKFAAAKRVFDQENPARRLAGPDETLAGGPSVVA